MLLVGGSQQERSIELPEEWIILDNNSAPHIALLTASLAPEMEPRQGKVFVPQQLTLYDYTLEAAGQVDYVLGDQELLCNLYKMKLAGSINVELYVSGGNLVAMEQPDQAVKFVLVPK